MGIIDQIYRLIDESEEARTNPQATIYLGQNQMMALRASIGSSALIDADGAPDSLAGLHLVAVQKADYLRVA